MIWYDKSNFFCTNIFVPKKNVENVLLFNKLFVNIQIGIVNIDRKQELLF